MTPRGSGDGSPFSWSLQPSGGQPNGGQDAPALDVPVPDVQLPEETQTQPAAPPRPGLSHSQKILLGVLGGLLAVVVLLALFVLGTRLPGLAVAAVPSPIPTKTPTGTPTPTPTVAPVGPVAAGVHPWDALLGGECLDPYTGPWAEKFTVVDCASPHPAQLVFRGTFAGAADATFPGEAALQAQISLLCAAPGVLDLAAAGQYSDAQLQGAYAVTAAAWDAGEHDYFCFISRSSGQALTSSVARAGA